MISVLRSPVIRMERIEGTHDVVGILELLRDAHEVRDILTRTHTGKCAVMRLLIAFLLEAYGPRDVEDRRELFERGFFDMRIIDEYVKKCELNGPRFLLDDEKHPFMQSPYDPALDAKAEKPAAALMADLPSGNAHIHLNHQGQDDRELDAATALEALLETYLFCPAGLAGPSGINNTPPVYAFVRGESLFETLSLNMVSIDECQNIPFGVGEAAWRSGERVEPRKSCVEMSLIKALTWRPRRVKLIFDPDELVRRVYLQPGLDFRGNGLWLDPHVPYRKTKDGGMASLKPELGRQLWRDVGMLLSSDKQDNRMPVPIANVGDVWEDAPAILDVELTGLITNQAAILGWVHEMLSLPKTLLGDQAKSEEFRTCVKITEDMRYVLTRETEKAFTPQISRQVSEAFLQRMREALFGRYIPRLIAENAFGDEVFARREALFNELFAALNCVFCDVIDKCGTSMRAMERQTAVRGHVMGSFFKMRKEAGQE